MLAHSPVWGGGGGGGGELELTEHSIYASPTESHVSARACHAFLTLSQRQIIHSTIAPCIGRRISSQGRNIGYLQSFDIQLPSSLEYLIHVEKVPHKNYIFTREYMIYYIYTINL